MTELLSYWYIYVGLGALATAIAYYVYKFYKLPTKTQINALKEALKWLVLQAEQELGGGTGEAKLRYVYNMALKQFSWLSFISFETFSSWVDESLEWLRKQLETNDNLSTYVSTKK